MNDYAPAQPAAISKAGFFPAMAPWILLTIATGLVLFDAIDGSFRQEALSAFLGLSLGAMALAAAGWSIAVLAGFQRLRGNAPVLIGIGQIAFVGWIYLRTVLNATAGHFVHAQLPVSAWELFLCLGLLLYAASRRQKMADAKEVLPSLIWVLVAILIIAQRELPRDIMLSSDPDQHLFWTLQVLKWGGVPFDLGDWGPLDFQYPAGFAVLSSLWTWLSFTTAANSVTIQPLLQSILAVLGLANSVAILVGSAQTKLKFTMGFMAVALFFGFFPSTLLKEFFLLEKSGSLSTQLLLISIVFLLLEKQVAEKSLLKNPAFYLAGIGVAWSGLINPVAIIIPGILYYVSLAVSSWHQYKNRRNFLLGFAVLAAIPAAFMLLDPYYSFRFVIQRPTPLADIPPGFIVDQLSVATEVKAYLLKLVGRAEFVRPMLMLKYFAHPILSAGFIVLTFSAIFVLTKSTRRLATF